MIMKKQLFLIVMVLLPMVASADTWDGVSSDKNWYDENTSEFHLYTASQLKGLADIVNDGTSNFYGKTIFLESDINLGNFSWIPIGYAYMSYNSFCGVFNGNNNIISNLNISTSKLTGTLMSGTGFFGRIEDATIVNLYIQGKITHDSRNNGIGEGLGGLVGLARGSSNIENVRCNIDISFVSDGTWWYFGGDNRGIGLIAGQAATIKKSYCEGDITATNCGIGNGYCGGIAGRVRIVEECCSNVHMILPLNDSSGGNMLGVGGIAGFVSQKVKDAIFIGSISVNNNGGNKCVTGGICGIGLGEETGIQIENVISAPSYFYSCAPASYTCLIHRSSEMPVVSNAYYTITYAGSYETYGTCVSEDYLKSGTNLDGFDKDVWEFKAGSYPRQKALIPTYTIHSPLEHGSIAYCVKEGEEATIEIKAEQGWAIEKVFVNQTDATAQMNGNRLVLSDIQEDKEIFVVYQQFPSGVRAPQANQSFCISSTLDGFVVSGAPVGKSIVIYDMSGMELNRQSSTGINSFLLPRGLYIVTVDGHSKKVLF